MTFACYKQAVMLCMYLPRDTSLSLDQAVGHGHSLILQEHITCCCAAKTRAVHDVGSSFEIREPFEWRGAYIDLYMRMSSPRVDFFCSLFFHHSNLLLYFSSSRVDITL